MKKLNDRELLEVSGGAAAISVPFLIAAGVTFIVGIIDGILRPLKCK